MNSLKISNMLFVLFVALVFTVSGCQEKEDLNAESVKDSQAITVPTHEVHPWEKERYNYEYLEGKVPEANQYLEEMSLNFEDLKQIHDLVNVLFGDYRDALTFHFDERTPDLMDSTLFHSRYAMLDHYYALILDYNNVEDGKENPYIHLVTDHIGERHGYLFVPIQVYKSYHKFWDYVVLVLKKDESSKYGFILCHSSQYLQMTADRHPHSPWFTSIDDEDDFSEASWLRFFDDEDLQMFDYYLGKIKECPKNSIECGGPRLSKADYVQKYNRQLAAGYSYDHAYDYNDDQYYSWKKSQQDCANFASQCLAAGGLPQDEHWSYFYKGFTSGTPTWRGAQNLLNYLINKNGAYPYTRAEKVSSEYIIRTYKELAGEWCSLRWGDLVFITQSGKMNYNNPITDHVYVITHSFYDTSPYYNGTPRWTVSAHTNDVQDKDIMDEIGEKFLRRSAIGVHILY